jgi:hypothetical protein
MNTLRFDYHVHPNFPRSRGRAERRARAWWRAFSRAQLNGVVISEHSYKQPIESFDRLLRHRPANATTEIFPGVEVLTKEGVDLVVYAENAAALRPARALLMPWGLSYEDAVHEIASRGLSAYVTHPAGAGKTSVGKHKGCDFTRTMVARVGAIERHNAAYLDVARFFERLPHALIGRALRVCDERSHTPEEFYHGVAVRFWAGGSDAHHPSELGSHVAVPDMAPRGRAGLWQLMHTQHDGTFIFRQPSELPHVLVRQAGHAFGEFLRKHAYRISL